jgi:hypothetical protein
MVMAGKCTYRIKVSNTYKQDGLQNAGEHVEPEKFDKIDL